MSIIQVAKAAGVSTATVSRVLNDMPGVSDETVRQVRAAAEALRYTPLRARRGNRPMPKPGGTASRSRPRTGNIAVITLGQTRDWLRLPIMAAVVTGIQRGAGEFGLRLMLDDVPDPMRPSPLIQGKKIDGAIVFLPGGMPVGTYAPVLEKVRERIPIVWAMGMEFSAADVDHVTPDNISTGFLAHSYLISKGCTQLAYLTANPEWPFMRLRGQAFLNLALDANQPASAFIVTSSPTLAESYGRRVVTAADLEQLVAALARSRPRPDGVFISNDATTASIYPLLARHGLEIGRDLTIVSCDNEDVRLSALHPRPASIDTGAEEIGFRAVIRLQSRLQRPDDPPLVIQVAPHLVLPPTADAGH
ncbi:MAG TPA: LacI family DNA-binding transcriptional regulator [Tepidisphaeraceae bacterium]|nr:LacI family DNA-binding transcriptional regulator [Tepidisphaeraceae bacterium]